jgi:hypothetical protein
LLIPSVYQNRGFGQTVEMATINMPKKMSPQSWQMLLDTLELWKKQAGAAEVF